MGIPIVPIVTVIVVVFLSMIVTRVATIALTLTGMSREAARFQARSALTGAGFTTHESESVVSHPVRRRIVMTLMLIGSAGIVTVLASVMLTFTQTQTDRDTGSALLFMLVGTAGLLWTIRLRPVDRALSRLIRLFLRRYTDLDVRDYAAVLEIHGGYAVSELQVSERDWLAGRTLAELRLNDEGVIVLGVQRAGGTYVGAPNGRTRVYAEDVLVVYGHADRISELDRRPRGDSGERRHDEAAAQQQVLDGPAVNEPTIPLPDPETTDPRPP